MASPVTGTGGTLFDLLANLQDGNTLSPQALGANTNASDADFQAAFLKAMQGALPDGLQSEQHIELETLGKDGVPQNQIFEELIKTAATSPKEGPNTALDLQGLRALMAQQLKSQSTPARLQFKPVLPPQVNEENVEKKIDDLYAYVSNRASQPETAQTALEPDLAADPDDALREKLKALADLKDLVALQPNIQVPHTLAAAQMPISKFNVTKDPQQFVLTSRANLQDMSANLPTVEDLRQRLSDLGIDAQVSFSPASQKSAAVVVPAFDTQQPIKPLSLNELQAQANGPQWKNERVLPTAAELMPTLLNQKPTRDSIMPRLPTGGFANSEMLGSAVATPESPIALQTVAQIAQPLLKGDEKRSAEPALDSAFSLKDTDLKGALSRLLDTSHISTPTGVANKVETADTKSMTPVSQWVSEDLLSKVTKKETSEKNSDDSSDSHKDDKETKDPILTSMDSSGHKTWIGGSKTDAPGDTSAAPLSHAALDRARTLATQLQGRGGTARVEIKDAQHGSMNLEIRVEPGNRVYIEVRSESKKLKDDLVDGINDLKKSLESQKLTLAEFKFTTNSGANSNTNSNSQNQQRQEGRHHQETAHFENSGNSFQNSSSNGQQSSFQQGQFAPQNPDLKLSNKAQATQGARQFERSAAATNNQTNVQRSANGSLKVRA